MLAMSRYFFFSDLSPSKLHDTTRQGMVNVASKLTDMSVIRFFESRGQTVKMNLKNFVVVQKLLVV